MNDKPTFEKIHILLCEKKVGEMEWHDIIYQSSWEKVAEKIFQKTGKILDESFDIFKMDSENQAIEKIDLAEIKRIMGAINKVVGNSREANVYFPVPSTFNL